MRIIRHTLDGTDDADLTPLYKRRPWGAPGPEHGTWLGRFGGTHFYTHTVDVLRPDQRVVDENGKNFDPELTGSRIGSQVLTSPDGVRFIILIDGILFEANTTTMKSRKIPSQRKFNENYPLVGAWLNDTHVALLDFGQNRDLFVLKLDDGTESALVNIKAPGGVARVDGGLVVSGFREWVVLQDGEVTHRVKCQEVSPGIWPVLDGRLFYVRGSGLFTLKDGALHQTDAGFAGDSLFELDGRFYIDKKGEREVLGLFAKLDEALQSEPWPAESDLRSRGFNFRELSDSEMERLRHVAADPERLEELTTPTGDTLLHQAAMRGHRDAVKILLKAGTDPNVQNDLGQDVAYQVVFTDNTDVMDELWGAGFRFQDSLHPSFTAARCGRAEMMRWLVDHDAVDPRALHVAHAFLKKDVVAVLEEAGFTHQPGELAADEGLAAVAKEIPLTGSWWRAIAGLFERFEEPEVQKLILEALSHPGAWLGNQWHYSATDLVKLILKRATPETAWTLISPFRKAMKTAAYQPDTPTDRKWVEAMLDLLIQNPDERGYRTFVAKHGNPEMLEHRAEDLIQLGLFDLLDDSHPALIAEQKRRLDDIWDVDGVIWAAEALVRDESLRPHVMKQVIEALDNIDYVDQGRPLAALIREYGMFGNLERFTEILDRLETGKTGHVIPDRERPLILRGMHQMLDAELNKEP